MKTLIRILKVELQLFFYSPIAWLLLAAFIFQTAYAFLDIFMCCFHYEQSPDAWPNITMGVFWRYPASDEMAWADEVPLFPQVWNYLYLYIPLLTMGIMSRELESGSIKLLYSSPVTKWQFIGGKYLALMIVGLLFIGVLLVFSLFAAFAIDGFDYLFMLKCLVAFFLLIGVYTAIGLFFSSCTSHQIVAAISTFFVLCVLNELDVLGEKYTSMKFVTDWFSIDERMNGLMDKNIRLEDLIYFLLMIFLFISLSVLRLQYILQKMPLPVIISKYVLLVAVVGLLGYGSARLVPEHIEQDIRAEVGFVQGHGERKYQSDEKSGYKELHDNIISKNKSQLQSVKINLADEVPGKVKLLILADMKSPLTREEQLHLEAYIARGGDLWVLGDPGCQKVMNPVIASLGVTFMDGRLVQKQRELSWDDIKAPSMFNNELGLSMPGCVGIKYEMDKGFKVTTLFKSDPQSWNEVESTDFADTASIRLNPSAGEVRQAYPTVVLLTREQEGPEQRIVIFGDADCFSNALFYAQNLWRRPNYFVIYDLIDLDRLKSWVKKSHTVLEETKKGDELRIDLRDLERWKIILCWIFPSLCILSTWIILLRRKNR